MLILCVQKVLVVEAPKKVKTLQKLLGSDYIILATGGHIKDLPPKELAVDVEDAFKVKYSLLPRKERIESDLRRHKSFPVFICTDADREGERIGAHVADILGIPLAQTSRVTYGNLSLAAITKGLDNPRAFDIPLLEAQEARRIIDRLMGYIISKWLWKASDLYKVKLVAAGRVQSSVLNLIVRREEEIAEFTPKTHFLFKLKLPTELLLKEGFEAVQVAKRPDSDALDEIRYSNLNSLNAVMMDFKALTAPYTILSETAKTDTVAPPPPLITSSLIKQASTLFGWAPEKIMSVAQELYASGLISYIRTDFPNVSQEFVDHTIEFLKSRGKEELMVGEVKVYKAPEGSQEAHEAIRPVDLNQDLSELDSDQKSLFMLIAFRALLTLVGPAKLAKKTIVIGKGQYSFKASVGEILERGWYDFPIHFPEYAQLFSKCFTPPKLSLLPDDLSKLMPMQYPITSQSPARYTVATLTDEMEKLEIGRPSTYVAVFVTLERHQYISYTKQRSIQPSDSGKFAIKLLRVYFGKFIEADYTRNMEKDLDSVSAGTMSKETLLNVWYHEFVLAFDKAIIEIEKLVSERPTC